ncbi:hypothetical protein N7466_009139 [Penicillium verhagenii]|uniref:uncharacterized protein n=1 Tax=Penicillium verhagenii TaxID=1562060 RepID=UPI002545814F|nr:uncharacterized protein N7466_009139 [Penicillium verhagenii]KAJ5920813.1 hypothetical protein N7466_009139 [Penicillium verhagenii]
MYVWRNKDLPPDPEFPANLKELGYFVNDDDQIRQIAHPEEGYRYKINRNDRVNVKFREALNECIRAIILDRLKDAGLQTLRLPFGRQRGESHVPILATPNLDEKSRIIVVFGDIVQDLGVWAHRSIHNGINIGSAVNFTKAVLGDGKNRDIGLVIANTGQLIWHCALECAVSQQSWDAAPRPYANWGQATMSWRNKIPNNEHWGDHIDCVFENVLWPHVGKHTKIDIIGVAQGGMGVIKHLQSHWNVWKPYISGICFADPLQSTLSDIDMGGLTDPSSFTSFLASRSRAYLLSSTPLGEPMAGYRLHGCNCYSSGEALNSECIITASWEDMLKWLDKLAKDPEYSEHVMLRAEDMDDEMCRMLDQQVQNAKEDKEDEKKGDNEDDEKVADVQSRQSLNENVEGTLDDKVASARVQQEVPLSEMAKTEIKSGSDVEESEKPAVETAQPVKEIIEATAQV